MNSARRKGASAEMKRVYEHFREAKRKRNETQSEMRQFERTHRAIFSERRKMSQKLYARHLNERRAMRALCRLHPIVPVFVPCTRAEHG